MALNFISSTDLKQKKIIQFNFSEAGSGRNKDVKKIADALIFQQDTDTGKIYSQTGTTDFWYINDSDNIARLLSKDQFDLVMAWKQKSLLVSDDQLQILAAIGGLPTSEYFLEPKCLTFPVAIKNTDGTRIDLCIVHLSEAPPFQQYFQHCILLDEVKAFYPSDLALSHELRLSSMLSEEMRMGFYPFTVRTKEGQLITYNGTTQFASTGDLKGGDIVAEEKFSFDKFDNVRNVPLDRITYIIGKWDERIENLYQQYSSMLKSKAAAKRRPNAVTIKKNWWQQLFGV
ncbi:MAG TPA: hypothetical protein VHA56_07790 [Mucilaginibacter sp.]|nr:hypothetical protein [Mucilaginibacter sp.]